MNDGTEVLLGTASALFAVTDGLMPTCMAYDETNVHTS